MLLAGVLGAWLHVLIESFYHYDVQIFWPHTKNTIFQWGVQHCPGGYYGLQQRAMLWCKIGWGLMIDLYVVLLALRAKKKHLKLHRVSAQNT